MIDKVANFFSGLILLFFLLLFFSVPGSIAGLEISNFLLFVASFLVEIFFRIKFKKGFFRKTGVNALLFVLWAWMILGSYVNELSDKVIYDTFVYGRFVLVFVGLVSYFSFCSGKIYRLKPLYHIHFSWIAIFSVIHAFILSNFRDLGFSVIFSEHLVRVHGFFSNTMTYSYVFGVWFCYFLGNLLIQSKSSPWKKLLVFTVLAIGLSLLFTLTRGVWIAVTVSSLVMLLMAKIKINKRFFAGALLSLVLAISLLPNLRNRFLSIGDLTNQSNSMRLEIWKTHLNIGLENVFWGTGFGGKAEALKAYYAANPSNFNVISHAHNNFIDIFSSMGIVGLFLFLMFFGFLLFKAWHAFRVSEDLSIKRAALGSFGGQLCFHIGGLTECTYLDYEVVYSFIILNAMFIGFLIYSKSNLSKSKSLFSLC